MTQRERILALAVGGMLLAVAMQWAFTKYRSGIRDRTNQLANLQNQKQQLEEQLFQGAYADRQMGEYIVRSLPSVPERAQGDYQRWLLNLVQTQGLAEAVVDPGTSIPVRDLSQRELYERFGFRVSGKTKLPQLIDLLHGFYAKDYLHRIREISFRPLKSGDLALELTIDAAAMSAAPPEHVVSDETSWRVDPNVEAYREKIMNRNFFSPPNQPPRYAGSPQVEVFVGKESRAELKFDDPEGHRLNYTLVGDVPDFIQLDVGSGSLKVNADSVGKHELLVRATDSGYPNRTIEQKLTLDVKDSPPPPEPEKPKPEFDDSTQTVLTGLVQGRDDWTAWMNVKTRGETLKLRVGDGFEIGSLKGTVIEVTQRFAVLEIDGKRFTLRPSGNLAEAAKSADD